jgi:hypothetical protein
MDLPLSARSGSLAAAAALLAACGADHRPAAWDYLSPVVFQPTCATASCHSRAAAVAGLDFSDPDRGYTSLMGLKVWIVDQTGTTGCMKVSGVVVCQRNFRPLVTPYNPEQSRIVNMLRARNAARMPPDRPLTEADIRLIEQWIRNGALRHERAGVTGDGSVDARRDGGPTVVVTVTPPDGSDARVGDAGAAGEGGAAADAGADAPTADGGGGG